MEMASHTSHAGNFELAHLLPLSSHLHSMIHTATPASQCLRAHTPHFVPQRYTSTMFQVSNKLLSALHRICLWTTMQNLISKVTQNKRKIRIRKRPHYTSSSLSCSPLHLLPVCKPPRNLCKSIKCTARSPQVWLPCHSSCHVCLHRVEQRHRRCPRPRIQPCGCSSRAP
jgi:hypothetical protein